MSGSVTPMAGMGSTGASLGSASMLTPQMIQMLLARARMMGGNGATPMQPGGAATPLGMAAAGHAMPPQMAPMAPPMMPPGAAQGAQMPSAGGLGGLMANPQMLQQLLAALKGGQVGINPLAGAANPMPVQGMLPAGGLT